MTNLEFYKDEIKRCGSIFKVYTDHTGNEVVYCKIIDWLLEEYKEPVLDEVEKDYLNTVTRPFRHRKPTVIKRIGDVPSREFITIAMLDKCTDKIVTYDWLSFPYFDKGAMYKGMELNKQYTLKELGL